MMPKRTIYAALLLFSSLAVGTLAVAPYSSHTAEESSINSAIRDETGTGAITPAKVSTAIKSTAAMIGAITKTTAAGVVTYHAPATRTGSAADNALWFNELETLLEAAANGDTFELPPVLFQPATGDASQIDITATDVTIIGPGAMLKRGDSTPTASGDSELIGTTTTGQRLVVEGVHFNDDGDNLNDKVSITDTFYSRSTTTFRNCTFSDPGLGASTSLVHFPDKDTQDLLTLENCIFTDGAGYAAFLVAHGRLKMKGGEINIPVDRKQLDSDTARPWQRLFMVSANSGRRISDVSIEGVNCFIGEHVNDVAGTPHWNQGVWQIGGEETASDEDGILAAVTDTGSPQTISSFDDQPNTRGALTGACPCKLTATTGGTAGDIDDIRVTITGTLADDSVVSEVLPPFLQDETSTVTSQYYYKTITEVIIPAHSSTGATTSIGYLTPRIDKLVVRDCHFDYERAIIGQYTKLEYIDEILFDGCHITHRENKASNNKVVSLNSSSECRRMVVRDCVIHGTVGALGSRLKYLTIEGSTIGSASNIIQSGVQEAGHILHIDLRDSKFIGMSTYLLNNTTHTSWPDYDDDSTVRMENIEYEFNSATRDVTYLVAYVPRMGFFSSRDVRQLTRYDAPSEWQNTSPTITAEGRLMMTPMIGDPDTAFLGRRMETPGVLSGLLTTGGSGSTSKQPFAEDVGTDAFPNVTGQAGQRIINWYNGVNDEDVDDNNAADSSSGVKSWLHDGTEWVPHT